MPVPSHFYIYCNAYHALHYTLTTCNRKHLIVECPRGHQAIPFVPGLNIPVRESRRKLRQEARAKQMDLFNP